MVTAIKKVEAKVFIRDFVKKFSGFGVGSLIVKKNGDYVGVVQSKRSLDNRWRFIGNQTAPICAI
jgi:hypothetical protein